MVSVVICSISPQKLSRVSAMYGRRLAGGPFEIIAMTDASGLAEAYNRGLARAAGDVVIFSHDDVEFLADDFRAKLLGHMEHCDVLGVLGTRRLAGARWWSGSGIPHVYGQWAYRNPQTGCFDVVILSASRRRVDQIQAMDGVFLCVRQDVARSLLFDEHVFTGFHFYDIDFTFRAHWAGYRCCVANDLFIIHDSGGKHDQAWEADAKKFADKHAGRFAPVLGRPFRSATVAVADEQAVVEVMTPPHWPSVFPALL